LIDPEKFCRNFLHDEQSEKIIFFVSEMTRPFWHQIIHFAP